MDGRCKEGRAGEGWREGGSEEEAGTNCRAKKVMKIAAQAGGRPGSNTETTLSEEASHKGQTTRCLPLGGGPFSRTELRGKGRRKRWQGGWREEAGRIRRSRPCLNKGIASTRCATRAEGDSVSQTSDGRMDDLLCFFSSFEYR